MGQTVKAAGFGLATVAAAFAAPTLGFADQPRPWELNMQDAVTPVAEAMHSFHNLLLPIIIGISLLVLVLLLYAMWRFREKANPVPSKTSHNTLVEVLWTVVPIIILVIIAVPSFRLLYFGDKAANADMTLKIVGHQWYWEYIYADADDLTFEARVAARTPEEAVDGKVRLLSTDNPLMIPVDTTVRVLVTSTDVIHSWLLPAFGVQKYAMPGRLNETWFRAEKTGVYYGQCNQICGLDHGFMPIEVHVVSKEDYATWVQKAKAQAGLTDPTPTTAVAAAEPVRLPLH